MKFTKNGQMRHTGWLSHEAPFPTPEEILLFLYREYHRQLNDPLLPPVTRCNRTPPRRLGPRVGAAIGRPLKTEGTAYQTAERMEQNGRPMSAPTVLRKAIHTDWAFS